MQIFLGEFAHARNLHLCLLQRHGSGDILQAGQVDQAIALILLMLLWQDRDDLAGDIDDHIGHRQLDEHGQDGKNRMGVGDLPTHVIGRQVPDELQNLREHRDKDGQDDRTNDVEYQVQHSAALALSVGGQGGQQVGGDRADGSADGQVDHCVVVQDPLDGKRLEDGDRGGGALHQGGKQDAEDQCCRWVGQPLQQSNKLFGLGHGDDGLFHQGDALEQHTKAHDNLPNILDGRLFHEQIHHRANE